METKKEVFEHFILNKFIFDQNLTLESSTCISFPNPFRGAVKYLKYLKVKWLSNLPCKPYNTTIAFHNWNEKKK